MGGEEQQVIDTVETVEVVSSGDDLSMPRPVATSPSVGDLMEHHHMIVANSEGMLVPTSEVGGAPVV